MLRIFSLRVLYVCGLRASLRVFSPGLRKMHGMEVFFMEFAWFTRIFVGLARILRVFCE